MESTISCSRMLVLALLLTTIIELTAGVDLTPRRFNKQTVLCTTKAGLSGKCVKETSCDENDEIEYGGMIDESNLRSSECTLPGEKCCSAKNVTATSRFQPQTGSVSGCIVSERPECPWCVKLYRNGKDRRRNTSGFFCMGTLIGSKVILTTGTCVNQAHSQDMWARIPSSPNPNENYTVNFRIIHPGYNSGTRENDLALLTITPEPEWDSNNKKGACLGLAESSLEGVCIAAGINAAEEISIIPLILNKGNCGSGSISDSSCGVSITDNCPLIDGSPVVCSANDGPFMMAGLVKGPCINDPPQSLLNNLFYAEKWLNEQLKGAMGLTEQEYKQIN